MSQNSYSYAGDDGVYCYPDSRVLINTFNIRDAVQLEEVERELTILQITELQKAPIQGDFDLNHLKAIHHFIFKDIYPWAGQIRQGDFLAKGTSVFCRGIFIEAMAEDVHVKLDI